MLTFEMQPPRTIRSHWWTILFESTLKVETIVAVDADSQEEALKTLNRIYDGVSVLNIVEGDHGMTMLRERGMKLTLVYWPRD